MTEITVFGKNVRILEKNLGNKKLRLRNNTISIPKDNKSKILLEQFLTDLLHLELDKTYDKILSKGEINVFGDLDFEVVKKIDGKNQRIAKLKRNKILVKLSAIALPKTALKYLIAHEIAHIMTKKHGPTFKKVMKTIHPEYEKAQKLVLKFENALLDYPI